MPFAAIDGVCKESKPFDGMDTEVRASIYRNGKRLLGVAIERHVECYFLYHCWNWYMRSVHKEPLS
jgi:hypothetical protein